jgi:hypothetical protein
MNRNPVQRGRWVVTLGAVIVIVACVLPWWRLGGGPGELAATSDIGLSDGLGFVMFIVAIATLLLIALPYAAEGPVSIDKPVSYLVLFLAALVAYGVRTFAMIQQNLILYIGQTPPIQPLRGPGFWIAALGLIVFARGVFELWEARRRF